MYSPVITQCRVVHASVSPPLLLFDANQTTEITKNIQIYKSETAFKTYHMKGNRTSITHFLPLPLQTNWDFIPLQVLTQVMTFLPSSLTQFCRNITNQLFFLFLNVDFNTYTTQWPMGHSLCDAVNKKSHKMQTHLQNKLNSFVHLNVMYGETGYTKRQMLNLSNVPLMTTAFMTLKVHTRYTGVTVRFAQSLLRQTEMESRLGNIQYIQSVIYYLIQIKKHILQYI